MVHTSGFLMMKNLIFVVLAVLALACFVESAPSSSFCSVERRCSSTSADCLPSETCCNGTHTPSPSPHPTPHSTHTPTHHKTTTNTTNNTDDKNDYKYKQLNNTT